MKSKVVQVLIGVVVVGILVGFLWWKQQGGGGSDQQSGGGENSSQQSQSDQYKNFSIPQSK